MEKYLTTQELSGILNLTDRTIRQMIKDGRLKAYKFGGKAGKLLFKSEDISAQVKPVIPNRKQIAQPV